MGDTCMGMMLLSIKISYVYNLLYSMQHIIYTVHIQCMKTESASVRNNMLMGEILLCALMLVY